MKTFLGGKVTMHAGDSREVLRGLPDTSIDSVVCDPPYALVSIVKRYGGANAAPAKADIYARASAGFMGKQWDTGEVAFAAEFWAEVLRVLKPGGHLVAFSGTRTYHRMTCAIEDAGFEIRDQIGWTFGSGFPKSHNIGNGWGTALKPAWEPICLARKPLTGTVAANVLEHGTGALNIDGCRVGAESTRRPIGKSMNGGAYGLGSGREERPSLDVIGGSDAGRWPANIVHDGSEEVLKAFPDTPGQMAAIKGSEPSVPAKGDVAYGFRERVAFEGRSDSGSAARFFYTAKADAEDRLGSKHPTVKPLDLMQWLVRLVTPKGGTVLDPFAGTGTTGEAAWREGMRAVLIEREAEYQADIARRMELADKPTKRTAVAKTKNNLDKPEDLPLFSMGASE